MTELLEYYDNFVDEMMVSDLPVHQAVIALAEEVGEACGKVKRLNRGDYKYTEEQLNLDEKWQEYPDQFVLDMGKELGDILYYLTATAHDLGYSLEDIIEGNVEKLKARKVAGTIKGSGDSR